MSYLSALVAGCALALAKIAYFIAFPRVGHVGPLPPLSASEGELATRLRTHVTKIAATPRNVAHYRALEATASHIEQQLVEMGYAPQTQEFDVTGRPVRNIEVVVPERSGHESAATLVVGAHYDTHGDSPGANDNGTGVAALLEIARGLAGTDSPGRRIRLVFFVNEEQPFSKTDDMGSLRHARALRDSGEPVLGMIALETLGYFAEEPHSQRYPTPFNLIYPNTGNFVAFVGLLRARAFTHAAVSAFRAQTAFPSIGGIAPGFIAGIDYSDHWAYDQCGFPALMITDTAPFRNPHYHALYDLPDTVDYKSLARITAGLIRMIRELAK